MGASALQLSAKSSPAVRAFELNPFRVLRLNTNVSTLDAANQAENALTLERVGLELQTPDPLPWLAPAGSYELQQAAQIMEEPLMRLKHQMLWFDMIRDPEAPVLREAIRDLQSGALKQYLAHPAVLPPIREAALAADAAGAEPVEIELTEAAQANQCPSCGASIGAPETKCTRCSAVWEVIDEKGEGGGPEDSAAAGVGQKGEDLKYDVDLDFWGAVRGTSVTLKATHRDECTACGASGTVPEQMTTCGSCRGDARTKLTCIRCGGAGQIEVNCSECRGRGWRERSEDVRIRIPAGIQSGMSVRLRGKGSASKSGGPAGDLYVAVKVGAHDFFRREGASLHLQAPLSPSEVAAGAEVDVPTADGVVRMRFPQGTKSGQKFRLAGKGVWDIVHNRRGDLYVEAIVISSEPKFLQLRRAFDERVKQARGAASEMRTPGGDKRKFARRLEKPVNPPVMADAVNHANLLLLAGAASIDAIGFNTSNAPQEAKTIAAKQWSSLDGFQKLPNPHQLLAGATRPVNSTIDSGAYWRQGLQQWTQILAHPWFAPYVDLCIADLGDDYVSTDDVEAVVESVRTQLVDLSAQQARYLLVEGRYQTAGAIIAAMADSGMEARVLTPAARPLRNVFQSEISELETLLERPGESVPQSVDAYLKRLDSIKGRWIELDANGVVGLRDLVDQAVEKAFLALRRLDRKEKELDGLLMRARETASAQSLRERISSFQAELVRDRETMCQFCATERPDFDKSVVLKGKKVTGVTYSGNTRTTHYLLRNMPMMRCARCARFHNFLLKVEAAVIWGLVGYVALMILLYGGVGALFGAGVFALFIGWIFAYGILWVIARILRLILVNVLTPQGHRKMLSVRDVPGTLELQREGFGVTPDFRMDAIAKIKK